VRKNQEEGGSKLYKKKKKPLRLYSHYGVWRGGKVKKDL